MDIDNLAESEFLRALDALYERGSNDQYDCRKFDPRGCREYQAVLDLVRQSVAPQGYVLVPVEPTREMIDAYVAVDARFNSARHDWAVMIAARPEVP